MKKYIAFFIPLLLCACTNSNTPASQSSVSNIQPDINSSDSNDTANLDFDESYTEKNSQSSPSDVPVDMPASISDIKPDDSPMSFSYICRNTVDPSRESQIRQWLESMGGLPGFTVTVSYDQNTDSYIFGDGMGAPEAIEYMEITENYIKVFFRDYVKLGRYMETCPGGLMLNSYKYEGTMYDGTPYTGTAYEYNINNAAEFATDQNSRVTMTVFFAEPMQESITDLHLYWGSVD